MHRRAFTLLEVLLTIFILGLIIGYTFTDYGKISASRSLEESSNRLRTLILRAQAEAMQTGLRHRISFPGTPDPLDPLTRDDKVAIPVKTEQPIIERQADPFVNPDAFTRDFAAEWKDTTILQPGTRCVAVLPGRPNFDINSNSPIAGPSIMEGQDSTFVPLALNPDGTGDWVTFILTDLPPDVELTADHAPRILNVIVDGRTGQTWIQRALRVEEVEVMEKYGASPILHIDFTRPDEITEKNILHIHVKQGGASGSGVPAN